MSSHGVAFRPIKTPLHHEAVIDQLTFAIRTGQYQPGDKLPSLDELSRLMGVSKPVVASAVRTLSVSGVLLAQRGNSGGLTVLTNDIPAAMLGLSNAGLPMRIVAILEARRAVETALSLLCADRATHEDLAEMEEAVDLFCANLDSSASVRRHYDHLFHYCVGRAAKSEMLAYYQHQILERLSILLADYFDKEEEPSMVAALHRETLVAFRSGDHASILEAVDRHLSPLEAAFAEEKDALNLESV